MAFRVELSPQARKDANGVLEWLISQHADETGLRWFRRLEKAIDSLASMPGRFALAPEGALLRVMLSTFYASDMAAENI
jgi:plasmid stabilization system protein ParE